MDTRTLSQQALAIIDSYIHFRLGNAVCSVPYFNNKKTRTRAGLRAQIGKGRSNEIFDEIHAIVVKNHIVPETLADESLKKLLVENNLGIECSGFAYYIFDAENRHRNFGPLDKRLRFINCRGLVARLRCSLRPVENCDVATMSDNANSHTIPLNDLKPGDMITMRGNSEKAESDHILVIHQIDYKNKLPHIVHYSHAIAYPDDGLYGSGIRQGSIEVNNQDSSIINGIWSENGSIDAASQLFARAQKSTTEVRRFNWF